ncbi:MAG: hypothetical protein AAB340_00860 [Patescibacteria group bacterium]
MGRAIEQLQHYNITLIWLLIIILAYLFFGIASFGDKLVLSRSKNPKLYVFYVGILSLLVLLLIPFVGILLPNKVSFFWIILTSLVFILGLYFLYSAVEKFDVSRVIPIVGAIQPIFILFLSRIFFGYGAMKLNNLLALLILLIASIIISFEKKLELNKNLLKLSLWASLLIALSFVLMKMVFLNLSFFQGIIWIGIFNFLFVLVFFFSEKFREKIFAKKSAFDKRTIFLVILTQSAGGLGGFLQNLAIFLAPAWNLAIINALRGIQYVFLFIITLIFSKFLPKILKEELSKKLISQKIISIVLIVVGLYALILG